MKVLLVANLNTGNTYFDNLYEELIKENIEVIASVDDFWDYNKNFDIIHIHFLENIFNWNIKNVSTEDINKFKFRLDFLKNKKVKIVITRHNVLPYNLHDHVLVKDVYNLFYKYTNGMIHLGEFSKFEFIKNNPEYDKIVEHVVIKHGHYLNLKNSITRATARKLLNIDENRFVFLCFGTFRTEQERSMVLDAFNKVNIQNKTFLCTSWNIEGIESSIYNKLRRKLINTNKKFKVFNSFVSNDNIQTYLNAADVLIVPRIESLNSGLVYLGLSFGKILIAPAIGNITEIIEQTNNLLFDPLNNKSLVSAMEKAISLKDTNLDYKNRVYAKEQGDWGMIAKQHKAFYGQL
jgi:hypothetical protein